MLPAGDNPGLQIRWQRITPGCQSLMQPDQGSEQFLQMMGELLSKVSQLFTWQGLQQEDGGFDTLAGQAGVLNAPNDN